MSWQLFPHFLSAAESASQAELARLDSALSRFYLQLEETYWRRAEVATASHHVAATAWQEELTRRVKASERIVDFGCGSAHILGRIGYLRRYLGIDRSVAELARNRSRWRSAAFMVSNVYDTGLASGSFDWAISSYVLEHCVWPQRMLGEMLRVIRPGGFLAVVCPWFRPHRMNSMWAGLTATQSFRAKLRSIAFLDAAAHAIGQKLVTPLVLRRSHKRLRAFQVVARPRCLECPPEEWNPDTDAVYWSDRSEVRAAIEACATVEVDNSTIGDSSAGTIYLIARKRGG